MLYLLIKGALSGAIVAAASEVAKRFPGFGGLIASLPLVSVLGMIWLWRDTQDTEQVSAYVIGALWFFGASIPMFVLLPYLFKRGVGFWPALTSGCALTIALYAAMLALAPRFGVRLS